MPWKVALLVRKLGERRWWLVLMGFRSKFRMAFELQV